MNTELESLAPSKQTAVKTIYEAFKILKQSGGQLQGRELIDRIRNTIKFSELEMERLKSGYIRWESVFQFYSVDSVKAGFITKNKGIWYLTPQGEKAMELGPIKLVDEASRGYWQWRSENKETKSQNGDKLVEIESNTLQLQKEVILPTIEEQANTGIKDYINSKSWVEFQDLVAALLRAMKYFTPFVAPKGRDGGVDIIAYTDPLGAGIPRLKVQVKHKPDSSVPADDIRSLTGILKDGDVGLFVTSGRFTNDAERTARDSHKHIKLLDIDNFIELWQEFYPQLKDEEKNLLPLHKVYFLGSNE